MDRAAAMALLAGSYTGVLTTLRANGWPVSTPMWAALVGDDLYIRTMTASAKVARLTADPRCTFVVDAGSSLDALHYVHVSAEAALVREPEERWRAIVALTDKYGPEPLGREDPGPDEVTVLRLSTARCSYR